MGFSFFRKFDKKKTEAGTAESEIDLREFCEAATEYQLWQASFWVCVNMIADALARCEFKTYKEREESRGAEWYLWNFEPNANQNATAFIYKLVAKLCEDNEALIISTRRRDGLDALVVADSWQQSTFYASRQNEYTGVVVGDVSYSKTFYERDVLHIVLHDRKIQELAKNIGGAYYRLAKAAMDAYKWENGRRIKVHIGQIAQAKDEWATAFQKQIETAIKPFVDADNGSAILPEFDGYDYQTFGDGARSARVTPENIESLTKQIFDFTAKCLDIPAVYLDGKVEATGDAKKRFLEMIDGKARQITQEINRKRYGLDEMQRGNYLRIDTSRLSHFDMFENAASIEKLMGSGFVFNDILEAIGRERLPEEWANTPYITKNLGRAEGVTNE